MKELRTEITINATPSTIWQILTDFQQFDQWNPFIRRSNALTLQRPNVQTL